MPGIFESNYLRDSSQTKIIGATRSCLKRRILRQSQASCTGMRTSEKLPWSVCSLLKHSRAVTPGVACVIYWSTERNFSTFIQLFFYICCIFYNGFKGERNWAALQFGIDFDNGTCMNLCWECDLSTFETGRIVHLKMRGHHPWISTGVGRPSPITHSSSNPCLLIFPERCHSLMTVHSNLWAYEGHYYSNHIR